MIILDRKKPISALKLIHTFNHTQVNRYCDIHSDHDNIIKPLNYKLDSCIYNLNAGLYLIIINNVEYIIDVYFDLTDGDYLIIRSEYDIGIYMAGSTRYNIVPYRINSVKDIKSSCNIETVNDGIDSIVIAGKTTTSGSASINSPMDINRINNISIKTESGSESDSLKINLKHSLGSLPNGARDYFIINSDQLIAHDIINTSKEILSAGLDWTYNEDYSTDEYYVFFAEYANVKSTNSAGSIRCSHFKPVSYNELINESTKDNCISTSHESHKNGLWIKISKSDLRVRKPKNESDTIKEWIISKATTDNPIYIEYEITNTICNTILIDEYHIKSWHSNTKISIDNNYGLSVFYKTLKSL